MYTADTANPRTYSIPIVHTIGTVNQRTVYIYIYIYISIVYNIETANQRTDYISSVDNNDTANQRTDGIVLSMVKCVFFF